MTINRKFPNTRLRRLRRNSNLIDLVAETNLSSQDLIQPLFIKENFNGIESIESMPGINRFGIDEALKEIEEVIESGINTIAVFPVVESDKKDSKGSEATKEDNFISSAIKTIKKNFPEIILIADVALDPYTNHGHDGIIINDEIDNDATIKVLIEQSLILAEAGADIIAPSDMMDGRVGHIRSILDEAGFINTQILSYAAKYASGFYGPFRDAIGSKLAGATKSTYQLDPANSDEAIREVELDILEGADMVMIKPGMPYLDIVHKVKNTFNIPTFVYQVSGEYAMIMAAIKKNWLDSDKVIMESLLSFKRAGANGILTYFAKDIAKKLK